jgi:diaminopimelate decarboxylase
MTLLDILPSLRLAARPRLDTTVWPMTTHTDDLGRLCVGGVALTEIADEFGTPTYVIDEADFRHGARRYREALSDVEVVYAAKALLTIAIARWVADAGCGIEVCSAGELATALAGGIDPARVVWNGNATTHDDLAEAVAAGVGRIVVDSPVEIAYLAGLVRHPQRVLARLTPDIDPAETMRHVMAAPMLELVGLHCQAGPRATGAVGQLIAAMADFRARHNVILSEVNICCALRPDELGVLDDALESACASERFPRPRLVVEPGRAVSARAGVTLCRVCAVTPRADGTAIIAVDGDPGVGPAITLANRHSLGPSRLSTLVARNSEFGIDIELPADIHPGDLLAVAGTGSTLVGGPPLVAVRDRGTRELIRRQTTADLLARDRG